jgi:S-adenosylmethionine hydrolase
LKRNSRTQAKDREKIVVRRSGFPDKPPIITLTTDFGTRDWFVGAMKGAILSVCQEAQVIDITHEISAGDIRAGAFALAASYRYFPSGTVHVAVVDPGVGGSRAAIAMKSSDYFFVGPDNGVLALALAEEKITAIHRLENPHFFHHPVSRTFHGRDVFGPVAAYLCGGTPIAKFGPAVSELVKLDWPQPESGGGTIRGRVVHIDRFGNAITNVRTDLLRQFNESRLCLSLGRRTLHGLGAFYQSVPPGKPVALAGSHGFLEIAVNGGSAFRLLGLKIGSRLVIKSGDAHGKDHVSC